VTHSRAKLFRAHDPTHPEYGWRPAFSVFGCLGLIWAAVFYFWFRNGRLHREYREAAEIRASNRQRLAAIGRAVTAAGLSYLNGRGVRRIILYVESDNEPAIATYSRLGFAHTSTHVQYARER